MMKTTLSKLRDVLITIRDNPARSVHYHSRHGAGQEDYLRKLINVLIIDRLVYSSGKRGTKLHISVKGKKAIELIDKLSKMCRAL